MCIPYVDDKFLFNYNLSVTHNLFENDQCDYISICRIHCKRF